MRWSETEIKDIILNPVSVGIKVSPENIYLLNVRGYYFLLGTNFSEEELTKEKFKELYLEFLDLAKSEGFNVENIQMNFSDNWLESQLESVSKKRRFSQAISAMINKHK